MSDEVKNDGVEETTEVSAPEELKEKKGEEAKEEEKADAPTEEQKEENSPVKDSESDGGEDIEVPEKFAPIIDAVESMTVLELNELVKLIEKKWGVSASAVAVAGPAAGSGEAEEKTEFDVVLVSDGGSKIPVMKAVKELLGLGLKEAKELVESAPATLKEGVKAADAEEMKAKIEEAGGKVELK